MTLQNIDSTNAHVSLQRKSFSLRIHYKIRCQKATFVKRHHSNSIKFQQTCHIILIFRLTARLFVSHCLSNYPSNCRIYKSISFPTIPSLSMSSVPEVRKHAVTSVILSPFTRLISLWWIFAGWKTEKQFVCNFPVLLWAHFMWAVCDWETQRQKFCRWRKEWRWIGRLR